MKILIASHWMEIGGAERALVGLLHSIDYSKHQVDLFLARHSGEFMCMIPKEVNLLPEDKKSAAIAISAKQAVCNGCADIVLGRMVAKWATKRATAKYSGAGRVNNIAVENSNRYTYPFIKKINPNVEYDIAISFLEPHYIVAHKVRAKKKIAWMHTDYSFIDVDTHAGYKVWSKFDQIIAISDECKKGFISKFPELENKIKIVENISHPKLIQSQAEEFLPLNEMNGEIKLLSIGRFATAKNFDNVPEICKFIRESGLNVSWYIIGYGVDEALIRSQIKKHGMEQYVILLGKKINPYPYIKCCDLYVQPSRYEGKSVTVREAQILGKPVVITNYKTAQDQVQNGVDGMIVPMDNYGCAEGIVKIIRDKALLKQLSYNCIQAQYFNASEAEKLFN